MHPKIQSFVDRSTSHTILTQICIRSAFFLCQTQLFIIIIINIIILLYYNIIIIIIIIVIIFISFDTS